MSFTKILYYILYFILIIEFSTTFTFAETQKIIEYGWDCPTSQFSLQHAGEIKKSLFNGLCVQLYHHEDIFMDIKFDESLLQVDTINISNFIKDSDKNVFIRILSACRDDWDWENEIEWKQALQNISSLGRVAREAHCSGLIFDPEPYGKSPWGMPKGADKAILRIAESRGKECMTVLQEGQTSVNILLLYGFNLFSSSFPSGDLTNIDQHPYCLYYFFLKGMLSACRPADRLVDGNEKSYFFKSENEYLNSKKTLLQLSRNFGDKILDDNLKLNYRMSYSIFLDDILGIRKSADPLLSSVLSPEEKNAWLLHNFYLSLHYSDEFMWCYNERIDWWKGPGSQDALESIKKARELIESKGHPELDIESTLKNAQLTLKVIKKISDKQPWIH